MLHCLARRAIAAVCFTLAATTVIAETISIGFGADVTSLDPHYHLYSPNQNIADHIFNRLIERNDQLRMVPGLALSWKAIDDTTWEFKLRPNVVFHDGSAFTADDVAFSIDRVPNVKGSPGPFTVYTKEIQSVTVVDQLTVRFKTKAPHPLLPNDMAVVPMVSRKAAGAASTADFNSGKAAIGTGPYKLVRYLRGDRVELVRNDAYWGKKPQTESLVFKIMTNDAARVAALMSGDVQVIDAVPVTDFKRLAADPNLSLVQRIGTRVIYMYMDQSRDVSPFITDKSGKPLTANPLKDLRVRQAISKAIDRETIRDRVMEGASKPTAQLVIPGLSGYNEALKVEAVDVAGAKKLLADAGYPDGFNISLHGTNNRYVQDDQILQAVAQMMSRVGINVKVEAMPSAVFFPRNNKSEFSFSMAGWSPDSGEASSPLRAFIATTNKDKGLGALNSGGYSNAKVDSLLEKALSSIDDSTRDKLLQLTTEAAMADKAVIVLHHQFNLWASRKNVKYGGRSDERTYGFDFQAPTP